MHWRKALMAVALVSSGARLDGQSPSSPRRDSASVKINPELVGVWPMRSGSGEA